MDTIIGLIKQFGLELLAAIVAAVLAVVGTTLGTIAKSISRQAAATTRQADLTAVQGAFTRADAVAHSAISDATEGEPMDEGGTISVTQDYLEATVAGPLKRLGADIPRIAATIALGAIANAASAKAGRLGRDA